VNILYVCADRGIPLLGGKGAAVHVRAVTTAMQALGHRVTLAVRRIESGNRAPAVHRIVSLDGDSEVASRQLAGLIAAERTDVVIERYSLQSGAARQATGNCGLPLTLEVNAPLAEEARRYRQLTDPGAQEREEQTLRSADRVHVVSPALLRYVQAVAPGIAVRWIPNGCDTGAFGSGKGATAPGLDGRLVVGFAGSMKPWHGVADLLEAFARVSAAMCAPAGGAAGGGRPDDRDGREPVLVLVGDGPEQEALRHRAQAADLAGRVVFTGALPHDMVPAYVRHFDIAVAPYRPMLDFYFHPLKIAEYLAAGVPVVYPDQGGLRDLVGDAGLGYPPGSSEQLAERLAVLLSDHPLRREMAGAAQRRADELDWRRVAERVLAFAAEPASATGSSRS